jgi:hypothetical protein
VVVVDQVTIVELRLLRLLLVAVAQVLRFVVETPILELLILAVVEVGHRFLVAVGQIKEMAATEVQA